MPETMPPTGLTLEKAKQYLTDNFVKYTITHVNVKAGLYFGLDVWDVSALEEVPNVNSARKRNFRLYTQGLDDTSKAWWEATQGPTSAPVPEPTFTNCLEAYIKTKIDDNTIKFGFIVQSSELTKKALCNVIMPDKTDKILLVSEDSEGIFSFEILQ